MAIVESRCCAQGLSDSSFDGGGVLREGGFGESLDAVILLQIEPGQLEESANGPCSNEGFFALREPH